MKTTVDLSDDLLIRAKRLAASRGTTLRDLIETGLRRELENGNRENFVLVDASFDGSGTQAGVDEGDWETIRDLIYAGRGG